MGANARGHPQNRMADHGDSESSAVGNPARRAFRGPDISDRLLVVSERILIACEERTIVEPALASS
jgi:hypothetical protein